MEDLDFSNTAPPKTPNLKAATPPAAAPAAPPPAPIYNAAVAMDFFRIGGKPEGHAKGATIFAENEKASRILLQRDKMYLLLQGEVVLMAKGKPVGAVKLGDIFGEMAAITESPRSATAVAKTDCKLLAMDEKGFKGALKQKPEFAVMLMGMMIGRLRAMVARQGTGAARAAGTSTAVSIFDKNLLAALARGLGEQAEMRFDRGRAIFSAGQAGHLMYVVREGQVAISIKDTVVERVGPGGAFGEMAVVDQSTRMAGALAEADCVLLAMNRSVLLNLLKANPDIGVTLLAAVAERLRFMASGGK
jgi:CRP-like cAMP-binding protein